jgi:hypothetical protein
VAGPRREAPPAAEQRSAPATVAAADAGTRPVAPVTPVTPARVPNGGQQHQGGRTSERPDARARRDERATRTGPPRSRIAPNGATERARPRTTAARNGPICQIRWSPTRGGSCFHAMVRDAAGAERTLATSPRLDWRGPMPPEQTPEAQAALRQLAKQLRDDGWRPMRAKGTDFDEPRWYARRFRGPEPASEENSSAATGRRMQ